jgi:hypothetical protein
MGAGDRLGLDVSAGNVVFPAFAQTDWTIIHSDLKAAAPASGVLVQPATYSDSNVTPLRVPLNACRVLLRVRYATAISAAATSPAIAVYGAYGEDSAFNETTGVFNNTGSIRWVRLNVSTSGGVVGTTMTMTPGATDDIRDSVWKYGVIAGESTGTNINLGCGFDTRGCKWIMALTVTPASVTGAGSVQLEAAFLSYVPMAYAPSAPI